MKNKFDEAKAKDILSSGISQASETLNDENKLKKLLERLDEKLNTSKVTEMFENIPLFVSCLKSYLKKEYTEIPLGSILAIISALIYWVSPIDIIPDAIPGIGYIDDAAVVVACVAMVSSDLEDYKKWRDSKET